MMVRTPTIKAVFLALMLLAVTSSAAYAACPADMVSYWQFDAVQPNDTFSTTSANTDRWIPYAYNGAVYTFTGSVMHINGPSYGGSIDAGVRSNWRLVGDFDIQVDYLNMAKPTSLTDGGPSLMLYSAGDVDGFYIRRQPQWGRYDSSLRVNNVWDVSPGYAYVATSDTSGKFRITRSGTTLSAYYWSGSSWTLLRSATNAAFSKDLQVVVQTWYSAPTSAYSVDYDNFIMNSGQISMVDGPVWTTGKIGNALQFDGSNDYVSLGSPSSLQITQEFSIAAWVYAGAMPDDQVWTIVSSQKNAVVPTGIGLYLDSRLNPDSQTSPRRHVHFQIADGSLHTTNVNAVVPTNQWVHIVATRKAGEDAKVYYNGVLQPSTSVAWSGNIVYDSPWYFGKFSVPDTYVPVQAYFAGLMDEVAIYDKALTAGEVAALYYGSNRSVSYCALEPIATGYDAGSTNLSVVADLTNVSGLTLVKTGSGTIKWTAPVDVVGADLSSQVRIGTGFVSINTSSLHSSLDGPANVSITVEGCNDYTVYYATGYQSSLASLKSVGQVCNAGTTPACTNIKCEGTTLSFTVSHFDGYGGEGSAGQPVPEFGTWALIAALGLVAGGMLAVRRRT